MLRVHWPTEVSRVCDGAKFYYYARSFRKLTPEWYSKNSFFGYYSNFNKMFPVEFNSSILRD